MQLCEHIEYRKKNCLYCELLESHPDIELQEIQSALLDASGSLEERKSKVLDDFRCSSNIAVKPAKQ